MVQKHQPSLRRASTASARRVQQLLGTIPRHACVGDRLAVFQLVERRGLLIARLEEAFHHDAENALFAGRDACGDFFDHFGLAHLVLAAVAVRGIDDQTMLAWSGSLGSLEIRQRLGHGSGIVVRTMRGTTQHQMAVGIALGLLRKSHDHPD